MRMMTLSDVFATTKSTKDTKVAGSGRGRTQLDKPTVAAGAWNKELLPHQGRHPNKYHDFVLGGMNQAARKDKSDKEKFLELFESYVKEPVRLNPDLLRGIGWE